MAKKDPIETPERSIQMQAIVHFIDEQSGRAFLPGQEFEVSSDTRAQELERRGWAIIISGSLTGPKERK